MKAYATIYKHEILIVDMSEVTMIDLSGVYALEDMIKGAKAKNIKVFVSNANHHIENVLEKLNFIKYIGNDCYRESKESINSIVLKSYQ